MLELICQQRYRANGASVDLSLYRNHGTAIDAPRGPSADSAHSPIQFPNLDSRVWIGLGGLNAWNPLVALKIEVDAKLQRARQPGDTFGLAFGDRSFSFFLDSSTDGTYSLVAQVAGPPITDLRTVATAPFDRWVTLGFFHDGFSKLQLLVDGKIIGQTSVSAGVPPVQSGGVTIGNRLSQGMPLHSEINEVRIWRLDPNQMKREFLCRPYDSASARCWEAIFRAVQQWKKSDPAGAKALTDRIVSAQNNLIRAVTQLPPSEQSEVRAMLGEYLVLWCKGHLDHARMRDFLRRWLAFLRRHGLDAQSGPSAGEIQIALRRVGIDPATLNLECDPKALAFFRMLEHEAQSVAGGVN